MDKKAIADMKIYLCVQAVSDGLLTQQRIRASQVGTEYKLQPVEISTAISAATDRGYLRRCRGLGMLPASVIRESESTRGLVAYELTPKGKAFLETFRFDAEARQAVLDRPRRGRPEHDGGCARKIVRVPVGTGCDWVPEQAYASVFHYSQGLICRGRM